MSDMMLTGVLRMPVDDHGDLELMQFIGRALSVSLCQYL